MLYTRIKVQYFLATMIYKLFANWTQNKPYQNSQYGALFAQRGRALSRVQERSMLQKKSPGYRELKIRYKGKKTLQRLIR